MLVAGTLEAGWQRASVDRLAMNCKFCPFSRRRLCRTSVAVESRRQQRLASKDMADAEASEKISLHTIDDVEETTAENDLS